MSLVILLGVLAPVVYLMIKVVTYTAINKKVILNTLVIAVIGMLLATIAIFFINKTIYLSYYIVASFFVGIIWGVIVCGCCLFYQKLNNVFNNKKKDI